MKYKKKCNILHFIDNKIIIPIKYLYYTTILKFFKNENKRYNEFLKVLEEYPPIVPASKAFAILVIKDIINEKEV